MSTMEGRGNRIPHAMVNRPLLLLICGLAAAIITRSVVIPARWHFSFDLMILGFVLAVAWLADLKRHELGLARGDLGVGLRYGGAAFLIVAALIASAALLGLLEDDRTVLGLGEMVLEVLVIIPIGTVLVEEFAFRGVLYGLLERVTTPAPATAAGALLFGAWHIAPIVGDGIWGVTGAVVATTAAGAVFIWLRRRSASLLAPILAHLGTNSVAFVVSWIVSH